MRDYAALERGDTPARGSELTRELLGTFIALAWQEARGIAAGSMAGTDIFERVLQSRSDAPGDDVPPRVRDVLLYRALPTGVRVELTDLKVGAQATGSIGRLNPQNVAHVYKSHPIEARFVLEQYSKPFPDVVNWVRRRVKSVATGTIGSAQA